MKIIKKIVDKLPDVQRDELIFYLKGSDESPMKHSDVEEYKRMISETQAQIK